MATAIDREAFDEAVQRGNDLLKQGKLDDAQKAFAAALLIDDDNAKVLALLGLTYFRGGKLNQARPIYEDLVLLKSLHETYQRRLAAMERLERGEALS